MLTKFQFLCQADLKLSKLPKEIIVYEPLIGSRINRNMSVGLRLGSWKGVSLSRYFLRMVKLIPSGLVQISSCKLIGRRYGRKLRLQSECGPGRMFPLRGARKYVLHKTNRFSFTFSPYFRSRQPILNFVSFLFSLSGGKLTRYIARSVNSTFLRAVCVCLALRFVDISFASLTGCVYNQRRITNSGRKMRVRTSHT